MAMRTDEFTAALPVGPLVQHVRSIHSVMSLFVPETPAKEAAEHSLRSIAVYSAHQPGYPPGNVVIRAMLTNRFPAWDGSTSDLDRLLKEAAMLGVGRAQAQG
jgi:hypothetical protein